MNDGATIHHGRQLMNVFEIATQLDWCSGARTEFAVFQYELRLKDLRVDGAGWLALFKERLRGPGQRAEKLYRRLERVAGPHTPKRP
ncbi:MAG: hypothetical protein U0228_39325 [Myxococcaceae bacterium]